MEIPDRILELIGHEEMTVASFARYCGLQQATLDKQLRKARAVSAGGHRLCIDAMPRLAKHVGIEGLIFYSARKSFAQHAFALGIPTSTIDYLLGHSLGASKGVLYHYIQVTPELASDALRKVIENLDNP